MILVIVQATTVVGRFGDSEQLSALKQESWNILQPQIRERRNTSMDHPAVVFQLFVVYRAVEGLFASKKSFGLFGLGLRSMPWVRHMEV